MGSKSRAANQVDSFHVPVAARILCVLFKRRLHKDGLDHWQLFSGNHPDDAQAFSLTSRKCFPRRFTELFKGEESEDQQLAFSGIEGCGSKWIK